MRVVGTSYESCGDLFSELWGLVFRVVGTYFQSCGDLF